MSFGAAFLAELAAALEAEPALAQRVRAALGIAAPAPADARLTLAEAASVARCGVRRLRDAIHAGELDAVRSGRGGRLLVQRSAVDAWVAARPAVPPAPAAEAKLSPLDRAVAQGRIRLVREGGKS